MKSNFSPMSDFGNVARDNILKFQLDNEVAYSVVIDRIDADSQEAEEAEGKDAVIRLLSKTGQVISQAYFTMGSGGNAGIKSVNLVDSPTVQVPEEHLLFTFNDNSTLVCLLGALYNTIRERQAKLRGGENIKLINGVDLLQDPTEQLELPTEGYVREKVNEMGATKQNTLTVDSGLVLHNDTLSLDELHGLCYEVIDNSAQLIPTTNDANLDILEFGEGLSEEEYLDILSDYGIPVIRLS